jgi:thiol-disulfide isomerase/thioredoxin
MRTSATEETLLPTTAPPLPEAPPSSPSRTRLASRTLAASPSGPIKASCRYDSKNRKILDFRLPDLNGRPVQLADLHADLILLDFWGTWCGYCVKAIPELVALQTQAGPERLAVVGIAYEEGPPEERVKNVAEVAQKLGINYPLLLGGLDGPCPLQAALHVQVFPTMVLLDRQGNVLWRDQGATPANMARLERIIAAKLPASDVVRR